MHALYVRSEFVFEIQMFLLSITDGEKLRTMCCRTIPSISKTSIMSSCSYTQIPPRLLPLPTLSHKMPPRGVLTFPRCLRGSIGVFFKNALSKKIPFVSIVAYSDNVSLTTLFARFCIVFYKNKAGDLYWILRQNCSVPQFKRFYSYPNIYIFFLMNRILRVLTMNKNYTVFLCRQPSTIEKRVTNVFQQVVRARITRNNNNNSNYNYRHKRLFLSNGSVKKLNRDNSCGP